MVSVCAVVVEDQLMSCCCTYLVVLAPNMKLVGMSECLRVGRWWSSLLKATPRYTTGKMTEIVTHSNLDE